MNQETNAVKTYPGTYVQPPIEKRPVASIAAPATCFTMTTSFASVKHILSPKPLRRPNRTRPL
jgi:hypothetical protein